MKLPRLPEIIINKAENGFIVKICYSGESIMKEPYEKGVKVFNRLSELLAWIEKWNGRIDGTNE